MKILKNFVLYMILFFSIFSFSEEFQVSPYVSPEFHKNIPWPKQSFYLQPWRSYMETVRGKEFLEGIGIAYNFPWAVGDNETALKILSNSGFKNIRFEIGWSNVEWDEKKLKNEEKLIDVFKICKKYGIKPLILLNAHHGYPCPMKYMNGEVLEDVSIGSKEIKIKVQGEIKEGYTALTNLKGKDPSHAAYDIFITKYQEETASLSRPLPNDFKKGDKIQLRIYKYLPAHPVGTPEFEEMADGWMKYVKLVCDMLKKAGLEDKDFELEIWNELSFGSMFIADHGINFYYDPPKVKFSGDFLKKGGHAWEIGKRTVDYVKENYPGTRVIWGFSNTTFYHTSILQLPPKIDGQSYHPYGTGKRVVSKDYPPKDRYSWYIEGYIPDNLTWCMPEGWAHLGVQTERLTHHLFPLNRKARPEGVERFYHYLTEHGFNGYEAGISDEEEALKYKAKTIIRALLFWLNKGISKVYIFCTYDKDNRGMGILLSNINPKEYSKYPEDQLYSPAMKALKNVFDKFKDSEDLKEVRQIDIEVVSLGKQYKVFENVKYVGEKKENIPNPPELYYRDMFTFLPFQINKNKFVFAVYVMSYDITNPLPSMNFRLIIKNIYGENAKITYYDPIENKEIPFKLLDKGKDNVKLEIEAVEYPRLIIIEEKKVPVSIKEIKILDTGTKTATIQVKTNIPSKISINFYPSISSQFENVWTSKTYSNLTNVKLDNLFPGLKYEFKVEAEDKNGVKIISPSYVWEKNYFFETEKDPKSLPLGLKVEYYTSSKPGEFTNLKKTEITPFVYIDEKLLKEKVGQTEMVAVRYTGFIYIDKDDKYTFYTVSDDGIRISVDDKQIINNWTHHAVKEDIGEIELKKGWHKILIEYFQGAGGALLNFYYSRSDLKKSLIQPVYFKSEQGGDK
ncbi:MAG TPA: PA14 domain-containing protein [bacterium]|nr:PA14 domain-containing protein [bacterium]